MPANLKVTNGKDITVLEPVKLCMVDHVDQSGDDLFLIQTKTKATEAS